jgi:hypothetical protein
MTFFASSSRPRVSRLARHLAGITLAFGALVLNPMFACGNHSEDAEWNYDGDDMAALAEGTYSGSVQLPEGDVTFSVELKRSTSVSAASSGLRPQCGNVSRELSLVAPAGACMTTYTSRLPLSGTLTSDRAEWNGVKVNASFVVDSPDIERAEGTVRIEFPPGDDRASVEFHFSSHDGPLLDAEGFLGQGSVPVRLTSAPIPFVTQ